MKDILELESGWKIFEDESNQSTEFLRNRIRHNVLPLLLKEGLDTNKMYSNFHEAEDLYTLDSSIPVEHSYLKIPKETLYGISLHNLKVILDLHLKLLLLYPIQKSMLLEIQQRLSSESKLECENKECYFWKSKTSDLYLIPKSSRVFIKPKLLTNGNWNTIYWNNRTYSFKEPFHLTTYSPGLKIFHSGVHKDVSEVLRSYSIPQRVRQYIPILSQNEKPSIILFSLWDKSWKDFH